MSPENMILKFIKLLQNMMLKFIKNLFLIPVCVTLCSCTLKPDTIIDENMPKLPEPIFICTDKATGKLEGLEVKLGCGSCVTYSGSGRGGELCIKLQGTITNNTKETLAIPYADPLLLDALSIDGKRVMVGYTTDLILCPEWDNKLLITEGGRKVEIRPRFGFIHERAFLGCLIKSGQTVRFRHQTTIVNVGRIGMNSSTLKIKIFDPANKIESNEIEFPIWDDWKHAIISTINWPE